MKIPYGRSDFGEIRRRGLFYVDKTHYLPPLESAEAGRAHLIFLRPRRFGKSTLLSMIEHYYDVDRAEHFDELFRGLWIHEHPTPERNRYLVLTLDFSKMSTGGDPDALRDGFFEAVKSSLRTFLMRYGARIPQLAALYDELKHYRDAAALMANVLGIVAGTSYKVCLLIDEYDNFANQLLSTGSDALYEEIIIRRTGFVRGFYATLKTGTGTGAVARMFITGVTPLMLDDLSSGFNIASNASLDPDLNALAGFTHADVALAIDKFLDTRPELKGEPGLADRAALLDVLEQHYDGYRFSADATARVFNPDMVLYFLGEVAKQRRYPDDMLDPNVRTEYRHLQRIGTLSGVQAARRRGLLETILSEGAIQSNLVRQFGAGSLSSEAQLLSLLYYLGMLTLGPREPDRATYRLEIPNRVMRELQWEHLALTLKEEDRVVLDARELEAALQAMGVGGEIEPFLDLFHERVLRAIGVKDQRRLDEKSIKLMMLAYLSLSRMFHILSEKEFAQGYCDLFLGASRAVPGARYSWLLELKYLRAGAKPAQIEAAFAEAEAQVARYASDQALLSLLLGGRELRAGMIVFVGAKRPLFRPWPQAKGAKPAQARAKRAPTRAGAARSRRKA